MTAPALLTCEQVTRVLGDRRRRTTALDGVDLDVRAGESLALVGRSGSGKSTLVGVLAALDRPDSGRLLLDGRDVWSLPAAHRRAARRRVGLIFQDVASSFDPRYPVERVIAEGLPERSAGDVGELLTEVGLDPTFAPRHPATLSGGERQRVALARALSTRPALLLADEPTTGLDVLAQHHVLDLVARVRRDTGLTVVFVTHDLGVAARMADRIAVLADGRIVEQLPTGDLRHARHGATRELLAATPRLLPSDDTRHPAFRRAGSSCDSAGPHQRGWHSPREER